MIVRADGYILTNDHVVEHASGGTVTVTLADGREFPGKVYPDFSSDLAVVKINPGPVPLPSQDLLTMPWFARDSGRSRSAARLTFRTR